ncbi:hypothetical protein D3C87_511200 [compost metagenome]
MMGWKEIDFKKRNKLLFVGAGVVLVVAWFLAFRKTYDAYLENNRLNQLVGSDISNSTQYDFDRKNNLLDSLSSVYESDSAVWNDNFLSEASRAVNSPRIQIYFNNLSKNIVLVDSAAVKLKSLTVKGDYRSIVESVTELEKINTLGYLSSVTLKFDNKRVSTTDRKVIEGEVGFKIKLKK